MNQTLGQRVYELSGQESGCAGYVLCLPGRAAIRLNKKDQDHAGTWASHDFGARMYDARVGRFLSRDPLAGQFNWSPYCFAGNGPIRLIDKDGKAPGDPSFTHKGSGNVIISFHTKEEMAADLDGMASKTPDKYGAILRILNKVQNNTWDYFIYSTPEELQSFIKDYSEKYGKIKNIALQYHDVLPAVYQENQNGQLGIAIPAKGGMHPDIVLNSTEIDAYNCGIRTENANVLDVFKVISECIEEDANVVMGFCGTGRDKLLRESIRELFNANTHKKYNLYWNRDYTSRYYLMGNRLATSVVKKDGCMTPGRALMIVKH